MKKYEKIILTIVLSVVLTVAVLNISKEEAMITVPIEEPTVSMVDYKESFIGGCIGEDASYSFCSCAYDSLLNQLGEEGVIDLSMNYLKTEQIPEKVMTNVLKSCLSKI